MFFSRKLANPTDDASKKALTARELMIEQFFLPFIVNYLRDQKSEGTSFMATPEMNEALTEMKVTVNNLGSFELFKMTKEQYLKFRYHFIEKRAYNPIWSVNTNAKAMELLLTALALILCKKVPTEIGLVKMDNLHTKVKMLSQSHF